MKFILKTQLIILFLSAIITSCSFAQSDPMGYCTNPKFDLEVAKYISQSVPVISCEQLDGLTKEDKYVIILDTREPHEFAISHIPGAINVGYDKFDIDNLPDIPNNATVVVYCSIGYRSEKIGEKLQSKGVQNVQNLYGSLFEWANQGYPLVNTKGDNTHKVHTYNKDWSKWVDDTKSEKVW